ncbi:hypothetical protein GCM10020221_30180 [Streptomyces thioluteus]|uniref:Integral membrane protein n=1 Tax=Streptomyces thioluteus TaxID=66431 RepID=A0ABN3X1X7_STRTU
METYFAVLRAQSRTAGLAYLQGLLCLLVMGLTLLLLPRMGLTGAGVAEISSLTVIVSIAAVKLRGVLRAAAAAPAGRSDATAPDGDLADLPAHGERREEREAPQREAPRREAPQPAPAHGTRWALRAALDADTLPLGVRLDFDHLERRPDVRPSPDTLVLRTEAPPPSPAPAKAPPRRPAWWRPETAIGLLLLAGLALYWAPLKALGEVNLDGMGGLGLVSVLPTATLVGTAVLVAAFAAALVPARPRTWLLAAVLLATVVSLHALPAVLEDRPRFATAWQHLGFLDYIDRTGTAAPDLDARWSWPGFFALAALAARACGVHDLTELLRWWPLAVQLACLAPLALLLRAVRAGWARQVDGTMAVRPLRLGRPGLLLPAGPQLPLLPALRGRAAGLVPLARPAAGGGA